VLTEIAGVVDCGCCRNLLRTLPWEQPSCSLGRLTTGMGSAIWCFIIGAIYTLGIQMWWGQQHHI